MLSSLLQSKKHHLTIMATNPNTTHSRLLLALITVSFLAAPSLSDDTEYATSLIKFKQSLTNATVLENWKEPPLPKLCAWNKPNWIGCLCQNDSFYGLRLEGMGLSGTIDTESLSNLPILTFSVMNNNFSGPFPSGINKLGKLRSLYLANNGFSGEIPEDSFLGMRSMRKVVMNDNSFTGNIPLSMLKLPKLVELKLQNNGFEGRIPDFRQENLTANFSYNDLEGRIPVTLSKLSGDSFIGNINLCGDPLQPCKPKKPVLKISLIAVSLGFLTLAALTLLLLIHRARSTRPLKYEKSIDTSRTEYEVPSKKSNVKSGELLYFVRNDVQRFELEDLLRASAEVLGSGSFGSSYKAALYNGQSYVVRRFKQMSNVGKEEFYEHMRRLGRLSHPNLLPLVAFYYRKDEKLLISNFVDNGSLASHLHGKRSSNQMALDWPTRLRIVKGVARGLAYLYKELPTLTLPHGHLKSSNVLLTAAYEPILSDYALSPVINKDHSHQFMVAHKSPESTQNHRVTRKTDVWSLGILILELLTGHFPANYLKQGGGPTADLATWVNSVVREEWTGEVFDKEMRSRNGEGQMLRLLKIGMCCCEWNVEKRWGLSEAVEKIEELDFEDDFSSYASDGDVYSSRAMTDEDFSFSRASFTTT
ncbi:hypothetical protein ACP275_01G045400 [Erythranthe tilingii]